MSDPGRVYDADYYLHGEATGKSLYTNYRYMPERTIPMVKTIVAHLGIGRQDTILDFGCALGYTVQALHELGYKGAHGVDLSAWAVENAAEPVRGYIHLGDRPYWDSDWILAKDVLEHIPDPELDLTLYRLVSAARRGLFLVVPLSESPGCPYVVPEYEKDVTHVQRLPLTAWIDRLRAAGAQTVEACYRIEGIKDNWAHYARGNGFLTVRKEF